LLKECFGEGLHYHEIYMSSEMLMRVSVKREECGLSIHAYGFKRGRMSEHSIAVFTFSPALLASPAPQALVGKGLIIMEYI
jgi:hypothetical protein